MAFFDFGLFKRMPPGAVELEMQVARAVIEGDVEHDHAARHRGRLLPRARAASTRSGCSRSSGTRPAWYTRRRVVELTPEIATQVLIDMSDPRSRYFGQLRHESAPPDHIFGRRMEMLTLAVISQLHARGNWHRIAREWFYGDPPGDRARRQEAEFYARASGRDG